MGLYILNAFSDALFLQMLVTYNWSTLEHFLDILVLANACYLSRIYDGFCLLGMAFMNAFNPKSVSSSCNREKLNCRPILDPRNMAE